MAPLMLAFASRGNGLSLSLCQILRSLGLGQEERRLLVRVKGRIYVKGCYGPEGPLSSTHQHSSFIQGEAFKCSGWWLVVLEVKSPLVSLEGFGLYFVRLKVMARHLYTADESSRAFPPLDRLLIGLPLAPDHCCPALTDRRLFRS